MRNINRIFGTGTMRSGGSLVSNMLSLNSDIQIFTETFYFFRHIYKKYEKINSLSTKYLIASELCNRIRFRKNIFLDKYSLLNNLISEKISNDNNLYNNLSKSVLISLSGQKKIFGEYCNGEWRHIESFLQFDKKNIAFQVIRDPRAILSSAKKVMFNKKFSYLNVIFNWADSIDYYKKYKSKYNKDRYLALKFEDIQNNPEKEFKKICKFSKIKFKKIFLSKKFWQSKLVDPVNYVNFSAYDKKKQYGFSKKRINNWKRNLATWEVLLVEFLLRDRMIEIGYKPIANKNIKTIRKGLKKIESNPILSNRLKNFLEKNKGTDLRMNDPSKPENWGSRSNPTGRFINDKDYSKYKKNLKIIYNLFNKLKKNEK